jgi:tol-pal system protein YbgF
MKRSVLLLVFWIAGFALPGFAVDKEVIQLQQSVALLQGMAREIQRNFDEKMAVLDEKMAVMRTLLEQSSDQTGQLDSSLGELQNSLRDSVGNTVQKVDNLTGQMQGLQVSLDELHARLDRLSQQITKMESASQAISFGSGEAAPPPPDVLYNTALRDYTSGNYPLALQEFIDYLRYYADTPLASNSQFYVGDIYYQQGQFEKAIQEYDKAIEQYPNGNKSAAAQLKKGYALINLNLRTQGARELSSLLQRFPNTPEASLAENKLTALEMEPETAR